MIVSVTAFCLKVDAREPYLGETDDKVVLGDYFVRPPWLSLYSPRFETMLVRIADDNGEVGWGEALAPVGPRCQRPSSTTCWRRRFWEATLRHLASYRQTSGP